MGSASKFCKFFGLVFCCVNLLSSGVVLGVEFVVGGKGGWAMPTSEDIELYNEWASKNRFLVNDTLRFKYEKDSVLEVTNDEYEKCKSERPMLFSNNGDTEFTLDRPGLYYFISGVSGHCGRGLKMIIKARDAPKNVTAAPAPMMTGNSAIIIGGAVLSTTLAVVTAMFF